MVSPRELEVLLVLVPAPCLKYYRPQHKAGWAPQGGPPQNPEIRKQPQKTRVFWSKTRFLASPGRDLSNHGGFVRFGALRGTGKFRYIFQQFFAKIPIPIQAFASCGAGSHAFLWTGQVPELRIYVVGAAGGPSFGPKSQFSSF